MPRGFNLMCSVNLEYSFGWKDRVYCQRLSLFRHRLIQLLPIATGIDWVRRIWPGQCPSIPNWCTNKTPLERENKWTFIRRKYHLDWIFKTAPGDAPMFKLIRLWPLWAPFDPNWVHFSTDIPMFPERKGWFCGKVVPSAGSSHNHKILFLGYLLPHQPIEWVPNGLFLSSFFYVADGRLHEVTPTTAYSSEGPYH